MSEKTFFFVKREIPLLFFVNCERADLFFVKRDLYPPFTTLYCGPSANYYSKSSECTVAAHCSENGDLKYIYRLIH